jgi:hypothetical protein
VSCEQWHWANGKINANSTTGDSILASGKDYDDVTLSAIVRVTHREGSLAIRMQDANNGYLVVFTPWNDAGRISLVKRADGNEVALASHTRGRVPSVQGAIGKNHSHRPGTRDRGSLEQRQRFAGRG